MDIWAWLEKVQEDLGEAGYERLADLIDLIPVEISENRPERAEAMLHEALATARSIKHPWLEVYLRHQGMQNRMSNLSQGEMALSEATSLLEFAHRPETVDCPQSICVTQDIAKCYGNMDGPGWSKERIEVCEETLARIDPTWPCFDCLSREYAGALLHAQKPVEAEKYLEKQAHAMEEAGEEVQSRFRWQQATCVWEAGRLEEALALYQAIDEQDDSAVEDDRVHRQVEIACILAQLGRIDEAWEAIPEWSDLLPVDYVDWVNGMFLICQSQPARNTWDLAARYQEAMDHMVKVGAHRKALTIAEKQVRLAVARQAHRTARLALETAKSRLPKLRKPLDAPQIIRDLEELVATLPTSPNLPVPATELLAYLKGIEDRNPERELDWLASAYASEPDNLDLAMVLGSALKACGLEIELDRHYWEVVTKHPDWRSVVYQLLDRLLTRKDLKGLEKLHAIVESVDPATAHWILARQSYHFENWGDVAIHAQNLLKVENDDDARDIWARAALNGGDPETALKLRQEQMSSREELDRSVAWPLLTAASAAQKWDIVRDLAPKMGMELDPGDGPVEENWGRINISFVDGDDRILFAAVRTGPVTARILEPAALNQTQHAKDWVVFDATPLERGPEDPEEEKRFIYSYRHVHTLESGQFSRSWLLDGVEPSDEAYATFRDAIWAKGWSCWVASGHGYTVHDPDCDGEEDDDEDAQGLPGLLVFVATPESVSPLELHLELKRLTADFPHPWCWLELAEHVDQDVALHLEIQEKYRL